MDHRIHGTKLAEMPFIATGNNHRCKGMCKKLMVGIESVKYIYIHIYTYYLNLPTLEFLLSHCSSLHVDDYEFSNMNFVIYWSKFHDLTYL